MEDEKLVIEFMGCTIVKEYDHGFTYTHPTKTKWEWSNRFKDNIETNVFSTTFDKSYSNDWGCLMEVVEKIEQTVIDNEIVDVRIERDFCIIKNGSFEDIVVDNGISKFSATYYACVSLIKLYNEQK